MTYESHTIGHYKCDILEKETETGWTEYTFKITHTPSGSFWHPQDRIFDTPGGARLGLLRALSKYQHFG